MEEVRQVLVRLEKGHHATGQLRPRPIDRWHSGTNSPTFVLVVQAVRGYPNCSGAFENSENSELDPYWRCERA